MPKIQAPTVAEHRVMRRRAVLDSAVDLLIAEGPSSLTPAAVAKMTGLARTSVYQYFPTGGALLASAVEQLLLTGLTQLDAALAQAGPDIDARIAAYVRVALEPALYGQNPHRLLTIELPDESRSRIEELHDRIAQPLREIVADSGAQDVTATTALAQGVIAGALALVERGASTEDTAEQTLRFLQRALAQG